MPADPVLHLIAGPNGAGKSTFHDKVLAPVARLEFVNADLIAAQRWPGDELAHGYEASAAASRRRAELLASRESFIAETVFSHPSKLELLEAARNAGYVTRLYVICVPEDLTVARVAQRVRRGGHQVPEAKVRARHRRLWALVAQAVTVADAAMVFDNSSGRSAFRLMAEFRDGQPVGPVSWAPWAPPELTGLA